MHTVSKDRVLVVIIVLVIGYVFFSPTNAEIEVVLLQNPLNIMIVLGLLLALLRGIRAAEKDLPANERGLIFEDRPAALLQVLDLSK